MTSSLDLTNEGVDVAIRYGDRGPDQLDMTRLAQEYTFLVASRQFAMRHPPERPADSSR